MQGGEIAGFFEKMVKGACGLLFNAPIDMLIERRIRRDLPALRHAQFCGLHLLASEALAATLNQEARSIAPRRILAINDAINGAYALFLDELFEGTTAHFTPYAHFEGSKVSRELYGFWKSRAEGLAPGDEYDFVDEFADRLGMQGRFRWLEDPGPWTIKEHLADRKEGTTNPALLSEKAPAAVMYLIGALRRFAGLTKTRIREIAFEIAVLGRSGLDYASPAQQYSLNSLPGETFSGLQLMCLMYVGFKRVEPGFHCTRSIARPSRCSRPACDGIAMLLTVAEFRSRVRGALPGLVRDLQNLTGRYGSAEAQAWQESFAAVDTMFSAPSFRMRMSTSAAGVG